MFFSIALLIVIAFLIFRVSPRERAEDAHVHGAGQVGLLAAIALFGVDYFTSFYYATGEMMSALHPYGLQKWGFIAVAVIAIANAVFGLLYMYSLGVFNEGGGSYTASMRYLSAGISLIVAVVLIQDYIFTIVVSTLSGVDQALSLRSATGIPWIWHFIIAAVLVTVNWFITIRGRGEFGQNSIHLIGHLSVSYDDHGCRVVRCSLQWCASSTRLRITEGGNPESGSVSFTHCVYERLGGTFRFGSHV